MNEAQIMKAVDLKQDEFLLLFTLRTPSNYIARFCSKYPVTFLEKDYELLPCEISGLHDTITEEASRPSLEIHNPNSMFNRVALSGDLEGSIVELIRVKESDLNSGSAVETILNIWKVYRLTSVTNTIKLELRKISDFPKGKFPVRGYYPPDFRTVTF